eukprot:gnl/TRDRNA2_/TRDRNA2_147682_c1_seq1.p1 gnl/TRDRNA2_/TRDRNA2_147682_c1~~gnl/TRDRNA2_/TRDRNA2_147682_c1_seq1.p1  ORF type:complete len:265 (+),score=32.59 gnl/TRDRNA2_/TRDRNA2_147682_c1_seq1:121-915(+)
MTSSSSSCGAMSHPAKEDSVTFSVHLLGGEAPAKISMKPTERVRVLKQKVSEIVGTGREQLRLVAGKSVLSNGQTMGEVETLYGVVLQLVKLPPPVNTPEFSEISEELRERGVVNITGAGAMLSNYQPTDDEIDEYAEWIGMNLDADQSYLWIAEEGLKCPLPDPWKVYVTASGDLFYFNDQTSESVWDHPCDEYYKKLYADFKKNETRQEQNLNPYRQPAGDTVWRARAAPSCRGEVATAEGQSSQCLDSGSVCPKSSEEVSA